MEIKALLALVEKTLDDFKAQNVTVIDVQGKTSITDYMVIATGTSSRHVKALAENVALDAKRATGGVFKTEGDDAGEWVLVDLGDVIFHAMQAESRELYSLEKLWETAGDHRQSS
ncbi:MAG: ribosome silencing factor [Methylococcales bacterium]|jgi:ribosome-associated protein|nr:ribosome silencing factor [Methylococcales bacterium]MBT7443476.1 ribosome silencing factor [Methylococcales bacterium]